MFEKDHAAAGGPHLMGTFMFLASIYRCEGVGAKAFCVLQLPVGFTGILCTDVGSSLTSISTLYESTLYPKFPILDIVT